MRLSLFTIEGRKDEWDYDWSIVICNIEASFWCGSLLGVGKFDGKWQFDLFWLRSLMHRIFDR